MSITNTITVNDEVLGILTLVILSKKFDCLLELRLELVFDYFLIFRLDQVVRVVLAHLRVNSC